MASRLNVLLTPARIGGVEIKNRIVMPSMTTRTADEEGCVTADTIAYYMARVDGGVGLITAEMASPERAGRHRLRNPARPWLWAHAARHLRRRVRALSRVLLVGVKLT